MATLPEALDELEASLIGDLTRTDRGDLLTAAIRLDKVSKRLAELYLQRDAGPADLEGRWDRRGGPSAGTG